MKHTSGRWRIDQVASGYNIEVVRSRRGIPHSIRLARVGAELSNDATTKKQALANARLMVASPLLQEAVKRFLKSSPCKNGCAPDDMTCDTQFAKAVLRFSKYG